MGTSAQAGYVDVLAGAVRKGSTGTMAFDLQVADPTSLWEDPLASQNLGQRVATHFLFGGVHYYVDFAWFPREGCLQRVVGADDYDHVLCVDATLTNGVFQAEIPSTVIRDLAGAVLRHPAQLDEVWAEGHQDFFSPPTQLTLRDLAPDTGAWGSLRTPIDPGAGPLLLNPIQQLLGSNGGPAVLAFQLVADNVAKEPLDVLLTAEGLPQGWNARIPARIHLDAGETRTLPLLVTIPGAHAHGETIEFTVNAQPLGLDVVSVDLAVHFFTVPQPAGHHPDLYLHSATGQGGAYWWMDTNQDHPDDEALPIGSFGPGYTDYLTQTSYDLFLVDLSPALGIGLDFDLTRSVAATFTLDTDLPRDAAISARLEHCNPSDFGGRSYEEYRGDIPCPGTWHRLAGYESTGLAMGVNEFEVDMAVTPYANLVPPRFNSALAFIVEVTQPLASPPGAVTILPAGSRFNLPLHEYQPPLGKDAALGSLDIVAEGAVERVVAPGSTAWTTLRLSNLGDQPRDITMELVGHNAQWASVEPTSLRLDAARGAAVFVRLEVPADAVANEFAQFYVVASVEGDDNLVALAPLRFTVDDFAPKESDTDPRPETKGKGAPGPSFVVVAIALLALAIRRRCG